MGWGWKGAPPRVTHAVTWRPPPPPPPERRVGRVAGGLGHEEPGHGKGWKGQGKGWDARDGIERAPDTQRMTGRKVHFGSTGSCGTVLGEDGADYFIRARILRRCGIIGHEWRSESREFQDRQDGQPGTEWSLSKNFAKTVEAAFKSDVIYHFDYRPSDKDGGDPVITWIRAGKKTDEPFWDYQERVRSVKGGGDPKLIKDRAGHDHANAGRERGERAREREGRERDQDRGRDRDRGRDEREQRERDRGRERGREERGRDRREDGRDKNGGRDRDRGRDDREQRERDRGRERGREERGRDRREGERDRERERQQNNRKVRDRAGAVPAAEDGAAAAAGAGAGPENEVRPDTGIEESADMSASPPKGASRSPAADSDTRGAAGSDTRDTAGSDASREEEEEEEGADVRQFLAEAKLGEYAQVIVEVWGYDSMDRLAEVEDGELKEMGMKRGHVKWLRRRLEIWGA